MIIILVCTVVIISPLLEELIYQGMLQGGLFKHLNPIINIFLVSVIFALVHGYSISWASLALFFSTLAYSITYYVTMDIKMAVLCHSIANFIAILTML